MEGGGDLATGVGARSAIEQRVVAGAQPRDDCRAPAGTATSSTCPTSGLRRWAIRTASMPRKDCCGPPSSRSTCAGRCRSMSPHRVLAWGLFHLPGQIHVRSVPRHAERLPVRGHQRQLAGGRAARRAQAAVDGDAGPVGDAIVSVSHHLPDVRVGLKLYNIVRSNTERGGATRHRQAGLRHAIRPRSARLLGRVRVPVGQEPPVLNGVRRSQRTIIDSIESSLKSASCTARLPGLVA